MESISEYQFRRQQQGLIPTMEYGPGPKAEDTANHELHAALLRSNHEQNPSEWTQ
jgi:hypothetical protein